MGQIKQLHVDCEKGTCSVPNAAETCYVQQDWYKED